MELNNLNLNSLNNHLLHGYFIFISFALVNLLSALTSINIIQLCTNLFLSFYYVSVMEKKDFLVFTLDHHFIYYFY